MFKPELWQSHNEYRTIVNSLGKKLSRNNPRYQFDTYSRERQKLLSLNLDPLMDYLPPFYSPEGRPAKNQAQILRSLILFTLLFNRTNAKTSLTASVRDVLPRSISLACICGFPSLEDLPPLGSYYDLMNRLWIGSRQPYARSALLPAGKNGKKPDKTIGSDGKLAEESYDIFSARHTVDLIRNASPASDNPEAALQEIFSLLAVLPSIRLGLINLADLTISGDGTAVVSHTFPYGRHLSSCSLSCPFRKTCGRHYSDPDAAWGWDSDKKVWYFGHSLYMLSYRNEHEKVEFPLMFKFTQARRHDSLNFLYTMDDFGRHSFGLTPKNICLDSAHDNIPTYELLEHWISMPSLISMDGQHPPKTHRMTLLSINKGIRCAGQGTKCVHGETIQ